LSASSSAPAAPARGKTNDIRVTLGLASARFQMTF
jgi:hypothetical protein